MILRFWRAQTSTEKAARYVSYVQSEVLHTLRQISGYESGELLTREAGDGVEIVIVTRWAAERDIQQFAGPDINRANVEPEAVALLNDFDVTAKHFTVALDMSFETRRTYI